VIRKYILAVIMLISMSSVIIIFDPEMQRQKYYFEYAPTVPKAGPIVTTMKIDWFATKLEEGKSRYVLHITNDNKFVFNGSIKIFSILRNGSEIFCGEFKKFLNPHEGITVYIDVNIDYSRRSVRDDSIESFKVSAIR
jgi:hypothetical protein